MLENPEDIYEFKNIAKVLHACFNFEQVLADDVLIKSIGESNNGILLGFSLISKVMEQFVLCNTNRYTDVLVVMKSSKSVGGNKVGVELIDGNGLLIDIDNEEGQTDLIDLYKELCLVKDMLNINSEKLIHNFDLGINYNINSDVLIGFGTNRKKKDLGFYGSLYNKKLLESVNFGFDSFIDKIIIKNDINDLDKNSGVVKRRI